MVRLLGRWPRLRGAAGDDPSQDEDSDWDFIDLDSDLDNSNQWDDDEQLRELIPPPTSTKVSTLTLSVFLTLYKLSKHHDPLHVLSEYIAKVGSEGGLYPHCCEKLT
jgi:hypothetical protein